MTDSITTCEICCEEFDDDPGSVADKSSSRLPVQSSRCSHKMCFMCLYAIKLEEANKQNKDPCDIKWVKCSVCRINTCYNTENPIVDLLGCTWIQRIRAAEGQSRTHAASTTTSSTSLGQSHPDGDAIDVAGKATSSVAASTPANADSVDEMGSEDENASRLSGGEESSDENETKEPFDAVDTEIEAEESFTNAAATEAMVTNKNQAHATRSRKRIKLSVVVNGMRYPEYSMDNEKADRLGLDEEAKQWLDEVSKDGTSVYRVRTFQGHSKNKEDVYGRKCSFWCVENGYVASASLVLTVLPEEIQKDGEACRDMIRGMDHEEFKDMCRKCKAYFHVEQLKFALTYRYFIEMKPGDIVVMQVKGKKGGTPRPFLVFGIIEDDSLTLMSKVKARSHGFPWDFKENGDYVRGFDNGIMLRKVRWYRQGVTQVVRGLTQADWLIENVTKWMVRLPYWDESRLHKKAVQRMSSKKFFDGTEPIDDEWVGHGLTGR